MRGPIEGVPPLLMPAAHALLGALEDIETAVDGLTLDELWARPGGAASVGFHLMHVPGSMDRLLTYARGEILNDAQRAALEAEKTAGEPRIELEALLSSLRAGTERALAQIRATPEADLLAYRGVGRAQLPSNVLGLIFHAAEHTQRHTGQIIATAKIARATSAAG
ncbi:MAG TPA: DinB family protein [Longimicrobium sp.]|nr:DinB family protein [Longimicrobium sp.]